MVPGSRCSDLLLGWRYLFRFLQLVLDLKIDGQKVIHLHGPTGDSTCFILKGRYEPNRAALDLDRSAGAVGARGVPRHGGSLVRERRGAGCGLWRDRGSFVFEGLGACERRGSLLSLPAYPIEENGRRRGPRDRKGFLPLPLAHWADPGSRIEVDPDGCSRLRLRLFGPGSPESPYLNYEIPLEELARDSRIQWSGNRLSFEGPWRREPWQIPIGTSRHRESWSLSLDERGRLDYSYSFVDTGAVLWVIPMRSRVTVRCTLASAPTPKK